MTSEKIRRLVVRVKQDEGGWFVATVEGLRGVHTQAKSLAQLEQRIREAILLYQDVEEHPPKSTKKLDSTGLAAISRKFEGTFRIEVPA